MAGTDSPAPPAANPFVGPRPYELGETLYGRMREIAELYHRLSAERVLLLVSPSGAGKSSLIQAGLVPRLRELFDVWRPARVNQEARHPEATNRYAFSAVQGFEEGIPEELRRPADELAGLRLAEYVARRPRRPGAPESIVLIFDQFEEILTTDPLGIAAKEAFFDQLGELLRNPAIWALFALREDYLAPLDPFARQVPTQLRNRYRIDLLGREVAEEVMRSAADGGGRRFEPEAVAARLADELAVVQVQQPDGRFAPEVGPYVEPMQLQVVCRRLWEEMPEQPTIGVAELEKHGNVTDALAAYYRSEIRKVAGGEAACERQIREWFDRQLIWPGGIRGRVLRGSERSEGLDNRLLGPLVDTYLVRAEKRAGATWYELSHDRLIEPVQRDNAAWFHENLSELQRRAALWVTGDEHPALLLTGEALAAEQAWADAHPAELSEDDHRFLARCRERWTAHRKLQLEKARRLRWLAAAALFALLLGLAQIYAAAVRAARVQDLARAAIASNLLVDDQNTWANLIALEIERPDRVATALSTFHRALALPVEIGILSGHRGKINAVTFSPDGRRAATSAEDGTARLWEVASGRLVAATAAAPSAEAVAFSPDGRRLLTTADDGTARLWDAATGRALAVLADREADAGFRPVWSRDGTRVLTTSVDGTVRLWDPERGRELLTLRHPEPVLAASFSPDGGRAVTGSVDGLARIWDLRTGKLLQVLRHEREVRAASFSPDREGKRVLTASDDETAGLWNAETGKRLATLRTGGAILTASFSPDGWRIVTGCDNATAQIWRGSTGRSLTTLIGHAGPVSSATFSSDGRRVATLSRDGTARIWSAASGRSLATFREPAGRLRAVAFSPDRTRAITVGEQGEARIWNADAREALAVLPGDGSPLWVVELDPTGSQLVTATRDGVMRRWNARTGQRLDSLIDARGWVAAVRFTADGLLLVRSSADGTAAVASSPSGRSPALPLADAAPITSARISQDGTRILARFEDGAARVWSARTGAILASYGKAEPGVVFSQLSADGSFMATASLDGVVRFWNTGTGVVYTLPQEGETLTAPPALSLDGKRLAVASRGQLAIWDTGTGKLDSRWPGNCPPTETALAATWSPDAGRFAAACSDKTVRLWNGPGEPLVLRGESGGSVKVLTFSPDGSRLATVAQSTLRLWDAATGELLAVLEGQDNIPLTHVLFTADGTRLVTAAQDGTVTLWGHSARLLQAELRARTPLCLPPEVRQKTLGESSSEAERKAATCRACVPRFSKRLGNAPAADWQAHLAAWEEYRACLTPGWRRLLPTG